MNIFAILKTHIQYLFITVKFSNKFWETYNIEYKMCRFLHFYLNFLYSLYRKVRNLKQHSPNEVNIKVPSYIIYNSQNMTCSATLLFPLWSVGIKMNTFIALIVLRWVNACVCVCLSICVYVFISMQSKFHSTFNFSGFFFRVAFGYLTAVAIHSLSKYVFCTGERVRMKRFSLYHI